MSKVSFRARALDASKQMPVFIADELPDLGEYAAINRAVAQMPTGMEKEEEMVRFSLSKMAAVVFVRVHCRVGAPPSSVVAVDGAPNSNVTLKDEPKQFGRTQYGNHHRYYC